MRAALIAMAIGVCLMPGLSKAENFSVTLNATTPIQVLPPAGQRPPRVYQRLINAGTAGTAWCSRYDSTPAANKTGSFGIAPFGNSLGLPSVEEYAAPAYVPNLPLWCIADTGAVNLTVDAAP